MKRLVCLLLVVSIACAGCYNKEIDPYSGIPISDKPTEVAKQNKGQNKITQTRYSRGWWGDWESFTELSQRIAKLEGDILKVKALPEQIEALLNRSDELETSIESQRAVEREHKASLVRIVKLEAEIESQRAEIENSKNIYRVYEVAIESQKLTIETLQKLCRLYETEVDQNHNTQSDKATNHKEDSVDELSQTPVTAER